MAEGNRSSYLPRESAGADSINELEKQLRKSADALRGTMEEASGKLIESSARLPFDRRVSFAPLNRLPSCPIPGQFCLPTAQLMLQEIIP